jgi:hypothetical protein
LLTDEPLAKLFLQKMPKYWATNLNLRDYPIVIHEAFSLDPYASEKPNQNKGISGARLAPIG